MNRKFEQYLSKDKDGKFIYTVLEEIHEPVETIKEVIKTLMITKTTLETFIENKALIIKNRLEKKESELNKDLEIATNNIEKFDEIFDKEIEEFKKERESRRQSIKDFIENFTNIFEIKRQEVRNDFNEEFDSKKKQLELTEQKLKFYEKHAGVIGDEVFKQILEELETEIIDNK